ncbi:restriction endonuclease subunit S [Lachnoanaerobaculum orale]|uniref:Restriction endonuclease subunit S n=1 Tax=Lachnoanaerobaculum orale TaxID=979627 RepID=A0A3P3Q276_9FIRM|nr:restriction endonuclease subunit S [Lachnoanaerobaculum orale]RRJ14360.1 restriction endonuclease subunit S [Lachnoanaerobaculum orale]
MQKLWEYKKLGDVCTVERGGSPRPIDKFITNDENGINWIKIGDTSDSMYITSTAQRIMKEGMKKSRYVKPGDFLLSNSMSFGRPYILKIDGCIHDGWLVLRDEEKVFDKRFLYYYLSSKSTYKKFEAMAVGGVVNNLNSEMVRNTYVPIPNKDVQLKIANQFDMVRSILESRKKELLLLENLVRARFVEMFGEGLKDDGKFKLKPISEIGQVVSGATPKTSRYEYWNGDNVWITPAELSDESFVIYDSERKLTYEGVDSCAVTLLPVGTVILSSRAPIGKVAIAGVEMYCNQGFKNIIPRNVVSSIYLYELLKMETEYLKSLGRGATFKEISKQIVENIRVKVPPIELQNQFATFVAQVNKSKLLAASQPQIHIYKTLTLL